MIAAVVAEYFGGLQNGLGSRITSAASNSAYARAWAFVLGAILLGLVFYRATLALERAVARRHTGLAVRLLTAPVGRHRTAQPTRG